jgi:sporulation protein YlmC with PRC-barrel domain
VKTKSSYWLLSLAAAVALVLAACGPTDTTGLDTPLPGLEETALPGIEGTALPGLDETPAVGLTEPAVEPTVAPTEPAVQATEPATEAVEGTAVGTAMPEGTAVGTAMPEGQATAMPESQGTAQPEGETGALAQACQLADLFADAPVIDASGQEVGVIAEIIVALDDGQVPYALLSATGMPELGSAMIPVPWEFLEFQGTADSPQFTLTIDAEALAEAPVVDLTTTASPCEAGADWDAEIQTFWNSVPVAQ